MYLAELAIGECQGRRIEDKDCSRLSRHISAVTVSIRRLLHFGNLFVDFLSRLESSRCYMFSMPCELETSYSSFCTSG